MNSCPKTGRGCNEWTCLAGSEMIVDRMPRINPHATALKQDKQLREQMRWLRQNNFKTARDALGSRALRRMG